MRVFSTRMREKRGCRRAKILQLSSSRQKAWESWSVILWINSWIPEGNRKGTCCYDRKCARFPQDSESLARIWSRKGGGKNLGQTLKMQYRLQSIIITLSFTQLRGILTNPAATEHSLIMHFKCERNERPTRRSAATDVRHNVGRSGGTPKGM